MLDARAKARRISEYLLSAHDMYVLLPTANDQSNPLFQTSAENDDDTSFQLRLAPEIIIVASSKGTTAISRSKIGFLAYVTYTSTRAIGAKTAQEASDGTTTTARRRKDDDDFNYV